MSSASEASLPAAVTEARCIDVVRPGAGVDFAATLQLIRRQTGRSYFDLTREFARLALGRGRLGFAEYVALRLFDDAQYRACDKSAFVGLDASRRIWNTANFRTDLHGIAENKVAANALFDAHGFPTTERLALYRGNAGRRTRHLLHDAADLRHFLESGENYPLFCKPIDGLQSLGSVGLECYDPARDALVTATGQVLPLDGFIAELQRHYASGYVFQRRISPHRAIRPICGDRLATVRLLTIVVDLKPVVLRSCWKIPAGRNVADNFWRSGNLLAQLEPATGRVLRVIRGTGTHLEELSHHPDTGAPILGTSVPNWREVTELALEGARVIEDMRLIGWDVAPTDDGATMIELNQSPDFLLCQLADRRGMLDDCFRRFLGERRRDAALWRRRGARQREGGQDR